MNTIRQNTFPHERLEAYQVALELARAARQLSEAIPRGHRSVADHLMRAAANTVLLLAEGADRRGAGEKRQRFGESRAECGEVAAAAQLSVVLGLAPPALAAEVHGLANRVAAMLTRLLQRLG
jgi:four helix bundle protein